MTESTEGGESASEPTPAWDDPFPGSSPACSCATSQDPHPGINDIVSLTAGGNTKCSWHSASIALGDATELEEAACSIADAAMRWRCKGARPVYERWRAAVMAGSGVSPDHRRSIAPFVKSVFGLPEAPPNEVHLRGWVAEFIWFRMAMTLPAEPARRIRHVEGPSFHATEPGGDGLVVWDEPGTGQLHFALWEIKNYAGSGAISPTVKTAYDQLGLRALEYLAKFTGIEAISNDPTLAPLSAEMVDLWAEADERCGVGVAVATSESNVPKRCFTTMGNYFPKFEREGQLEGLVAGVGGFASFCDDVKERIWIAL